MYRYYAYVMRLQHGVQARAVLKLVSARVELFIFKSQHPNDNPGESNKETHKEDPKEGKTMPGKSKGMPRGSQRMTKGLNNSSQHEG